MSESNYKQWERILDPLGYAAEVDGEHLNFKTRHTLEVSEIFQRETHKNFEDPTLDSVKFTLRLNGAEKRLLCYDSQTNGWFEMEVVNDNAPLLAVASGERVSIEINAKTKQRVNRIETVEEFAFLRGEFVMPDTYVGFNGAPVIMFHPNKEFVIILTVGCKSKEGLPCITDAQINFKL